MGMNRREFLSGVTAITAAGLCGARGGLAFGQCDSSTLDGRYLRGKTAGQLSISFLGTFAIFVFTDHIEAFTPKILGNDQKPLHNYWLARPTGNEGLESSRLFDLKLENTFDGIDNRGQTPAFVECKPDQHNSFDRAVNLILPVMPAPPLTPLPTDFLAHVKLPLPNDIVLANWSQRGSGPIFAKQRDFFNLARDHVFLYDASRFDKTKLKFNTATVDPGPDLSLRFVSEPISDTLMEQECETPPGHVQRAMTALSLMLNMDRDAFRVTIPYCNQQQVPVARPLASLRPADGGGGGATGTMSSRFPACQSVIINNTSA